MPFLKKLSGTPPGQFIELKGDLIVIGRSPECDIILDPHGVSRRHAEIRHQGDGYVLADLRSRNKTKVNAKEIPPGQVHSLRPGDRINICDVEFLYTPALPARPPRPATQEMIVTEGGAEDSALKVLDASRFGLGTVTVRPEAKLKAILDITRNLSRDLNIDTVAPKVLETLFELFARAERAFLILRDPDSGRLVRKAFKHRNQRSGLRGLVGSTSGDDEVPMSISRTIVNHVLERKEAVISQDAGHDPNLPLSASIADLKIRSIMCAPLLTPDGQALGILQLDTADRRQFQQEDLDLMAAVACQAAVAIQNAAMHESLLARDRLDRDLRLAEQVQKRFLPLDVPRVAGYEFFAHYNPAYEIGGDFYDFINLPHGRLAVALGDVAGKGVAAALMMAKFSGDARFCILAEGAPGPAADHLNNLLCAAGFEEKFITLSLGILDPASHRYTLASAGHLPMLVRRASGLVEEVGADVAGFPLGIQPDSSYQQVETTLAPGDVAVLYSDGVTDARNAAEDLYDSIEHRRLIARVGATPGGPEAVGRALLQEIREFSAGHPQADDITLVCFGPL